MAPKVAQILGATRAALAVVVAALVAALAASSSSCGGGAGGGASDAAGDVTAVDRVGPIDAGQASCDRYQAQIGAAPSPPFDVVQQIFDDNCTTCHALGAALDLSPGISYAHIVNQAAPAVESCGGILIVPGDPTSSYLYQKLTLSHPCAGAQMPLDELFTSQPLPACMISILRGWIQAGAQPSTGSSPDGAAAGG